MFNQFDKSGGSAADHQDQGDAWVRITARSREQLGRSSYVIYVISPYGTLGEGRGGPHPPKPGWADLPRLPPLVL